MQLVAWSAFEAERRLAPLARRWKHTLGVVDRAREFAGAVAAGEREVLIAAAYLHDVGYAPELVASGFHPLDGARWLRGEGRERLACLIAHHSGACFEARMRGLDTALAQFPAERSVIADLLTYCDLRTDPDGRRVTPAARLTEIQRRHGAGSVVSRSIDASRPALWALVSRTEHLLERTLIGA